MHGLRGLPGLSGLHLSLFLAGVVWLAHFAAAGSFGLYEDDYLFIGDAFGRDASYLIERLQVFRSLPQGRPIGYFLPQLLSFVGDHLGGLRVVYLLAYGVVALNTLLCYALLRRGARAPAFAALAGALMFGLYPGDTTRPLLTHAFQLQPSLTFFLLASLAYLSGRARLSYVLILGSLLAYESPFTLFFGVPLLQPGPWDRARLRRLARHAAVLVLLLAGAVGLRLLVGETRAVESTGAVGPLLPRVLLSLVVGPARALAMLLYGPLVWLPTWSLAMALSAAVAFASTTLLLRATAKRALEDAPTWPARGRLGRIETLAERGGVPSWALRLLLVGAVLLVLAYALAFTHYPPNAVYGRGTSVHLAASVGMAVLFAGAAGALHGLIRRLGLPAVLAPALLAAYVALTVGYHQVAQRDFATAWALQQAFWRDVVRLAPDMGEDTLLIFARDTPDETTFIQVNSWADPLVLDLSFEFPGQWQRPPRLFTLSLAGLEARVEPDPGGGLRWWVPAARWEEHWEALPEGNVILLRREAGRLVRQEGTITLAGRPFELKAAPATAADGSGWPPGRLFTVVFGGSGAPVGTP